MKIFDGLENNLHIPNAHLTIGTFDGVHIGHQKIIKRLIEQAKTNHGESVLFTFHPHPRTVINPDIKVPLLQTIDEKLQKLKRLGLQNVILYPFTKDFSQTLAETFIKDFLVDKLQMQRVVIGYDHQFGRNREGSLEHFQKLSKEYHFSVEEIPAQDVDDIKVSSTKIRTALSDGQVNIASNYLGEPFLLTGRVVHGLAIGRTIGFPTANIQLSDENKIIPKNGVYFVRTCIEEKVHFGMMNIGVRPTISNNKKEQISLELHIFDFQKDIYDANIQVEFLSFIRDEQAFRDTNYLRQQLEQDEQICRGIFDNYPHSAFIL